MIFIYKRRKNFAKNFQILPKFWYFIEVSIVVGLEAPTQVPDQVEPGDQAAAKDRYILQQEVAPQLIW